MLTNEREGNRVKSAKYWPSSEEQELQQGPYIVRLMEEDIYANFTIRSIELVVCIKHSSILICSNACIAILAIGWVSVHFTSETVPLHHLAGPRGA